MTPYSSLPSRNFWAPAVGARPALEITDLWVPKFSIKPRDRIATFGSCFAQHFGRALKERNFRWTDFEPPPQGLGPEGIAKFNYGTFSARTGNIYTTNLLQQWCEWATGVATPPDEVWEKDGRFFDPFRPAIEPQGFCSAEEMRANRLLTIEAFGAAMRRATVFVFTLGLTESWRNAVAGYEYAICPGTAAGEFDAASHVFVNETYGRIAASLEGALALLRKVNPGLRVLLTVSPVPLTATATDQHVLVATSYSKSVLRAVAGDVAAGSADIDYFPSYEIITAPPYGGAFFAPNKRSVLQEGVDHVMAQFFKAQTDAFGAPDLAATGRLDGADDVDSDAADDEDGPAGPVTLRQDDLVCEEALLAAFGPRV